MKNLFIVYPGGCGGNHIANLISTNQKFTQLFDSDNYHQDLLNHYKKLYESPLAGPKKNHLFSVGKKEVHIVKAHYSKYHHLEQLFDNKLFDEMNSKSTINILIGHEHCFEEAERYNNSVSKVPDPFWIIFTFPKSNSIPRRRVDLYEFTPAPDRYTYPFYTLFDSPEYAKTELSNSTLFETEELFTENGVNYLRQQLSKVDIELPPIADELHDLWYKKLIEVLVLYDELPK